MKVEHPFSLKRAAPEYVRVLKERRVSLGISQDIVATNLGISAMGLSYLERGERTVKVDMLEKWAGIIGLELVISYSETTNDTRDNASSGTKENESSDY